MHRRIGNTRLTTLWLNDSIALKWLTTISRYPNFMVFAIMPSPLVPSRLQHEKNLLLNSSFSSVDYQ